MVFPTVVLACLCHCDLPRWFENEKICGHYVLEDCASMHIHCLRNALGRLIRTHLARLSQDFWLRRRRSQQTDDGGKFRENSHSAKAFAMRCLILSVPGGSNSDK